jgi:hypothetical protein
MIARMIFRLPYTIALAAGQVFDSLSRTDGETGIVIHPLTQFKEMVGIAAPTFEVPPRPSTRVRYNDEPVFEMDTLTIDLIRPRFERTRNTTQSTPETISTPGTIREGYAYANEFLAMLRNATQNPEIRPIEGAVYLQFLNDDGSELPHEDDKFRMTLWLGAQEFRNPVVDLLHWNALRTTNFDDLQHRTLLLEASALFPEPASIILGYSAVEAVTKMIISDLVEKQLPNGTAKWVIKTALRESSLKVLFTGVFRALTNAELLGDHEFAKRFDRVNKMRNSIVHRGRLEVDGHSVSRAELYKALGDCRAMVNKLEETGSVAPGPSVDCSEYELRIAIMLGNWGKDGPNIKFTPKTKPPVD